MSDLSDAERTLIADALHAYGRGWLDQNRGDRLPVSERKKNDARQRACEALRAKVIEERS